MRFATYTVNLERKGPGLLLRDIQRGKEKQIKAVIANIVEVRPDVLAIQRFDWDQELWALSAFQDALRDAGWDLPHALAPRPNSGSPTGVDVDGDGKISLPWDAQGFGYYPGNRGLAVLSRYPISNRFASLTQELWSTAPIGPKNRSTDAGALAQVQRLSSVAHIKIAIDINDQTVEVITFHASPPVFDGPDDRNGRRNADEIDMVRNWWFPLVDTDIYDENFIILANMNLDPYDGEGLREVVRGVLADGRIQDPKPQSAGGVAAADADHLGNPALDTADWPDDRPGNLRVSYALPSSSMTVINSGVHWPIGMDTTAGPHKIVWVDVDIP